MLQAIATDAGTYPPHTVTRHDTAGCPVEFEKGGWIELEWEYEPRVFETRRVQVSRARALQAMSALAHASTTEDQSRAIISGFSFPPSPV